MLGEWPSLPIEQARVDAGLVRARIQRQHADPAEEVRRTRREAEEQRIAEARARAYTFARLAREYLDASKHGFRAPKQRHRKSASTIYREEKVLAKHGWRLTMQGRVGSQTQQTVSSSASLRPAARRSVRMEIG